MGDSDVRISDAERDEVVTVLRDATSAGRLTLEEFEERLGEVFAARTAGDLQHALRELPVQPERPPAPVPEEAALRRRWHRRLRGEVVTFVLPNAVCNAIWLAGDAERWWPGWVLLFTALGLGGTLAKGFDPDAERAKLEAEERARAIADIEIRRTLRR
jgi:hypothetical protein